VEVIIDMSVGSQRGDEEMIWEVYLISQRKTLQKQFKKGAQEG
jgi:hypothetical protein